jgi:hypothetical protein
MTDLSTYVVSGVSSQGFVERLKTDKPLLQENTGMVPLLTIN